MPVFARTDEPTTPPAIRPNFLSDPDDLRLLAHGVKLARQIVSGRAFDELRGEEIDPGPAVSRPEDIEAWIRRRAQTAVRSRAPTRGRAPIEDRREIGCGHCLWWTVEADDEQHALAQLPPFVADPTEVTAVREVSIP